MHRFFLPPEAVQAEFVELGDREAHHALHVLRLRVGDRAVVLTGAGDELAVEIVETRRATVICRVWRRTKQERPKFQITLLQSIAKNKAMEFIIQKATELGVARIVPILTEHSVVHLEGEGEGKTAKWRAIAMEATKQCGAVWLPVIETPVTLGEFFRHPIPLDLCLIAALQAEARHARLWLEEYAVTHRGAPVSAGLWVGPEGDFSPRELAAILAAGAKPVSLGPLTLRSETAALYGLAILQHEMQWYAFHRPS